MSWSRQFLVAGTDARPKLVKKRNKRDNHMHRHCLTQPGSLGTADPGAQSEYITRDRLLAVLRSTFSRLILPPAAGKAVAENSKTESLQWDIRNKEKFFFPLCANKEQFSGWC